MQALILASASPRRRELLMQIGLDCEVCPASIDETPLAGESPALYVARMAREKAQRVAAQKAGRAVLAADTTVVIDEDILGKPRDRMSALAMLARLSGRTHQVMTAICLARNGGFHQRTVLTEVSFVTLDRELCEAYLDTSEPWDKAGAYAIQGLAAIFVERIAGSYSNVVGLPLSETWGLLREQGLVARPGDSV